MVASSPLEVRVAVVEPRLRVLLVAAVGQVGVVVAGADSSQKAGVGEKEVKENLGVEGPVAGIVVDEGGGDVEVAGAGGGV